MNDVLIINKDRSKIKISVTILRNSAKNNVEYSMSGQQKAKNARKWLHVVNVDSNTYRKLSMEDRRVYENNVILSLIGAEKYNAILTEAWNSLKPRLAREGK